MLFPDAFAIWNVSFLLVVATRTFLAPFLPMVAMMVALTWTTSDANLETGADTFDHVVRRLAFVVYGALSGAAVAAAAGTRVLIPIHTFSGKNPHWAGTLSVLTASFIPYSLAVAAGWAEPFEEWSGNDAGRKALYSIMFIVCVGILGSILYTSWRGWHRCPMAYRYGDSGIFAEDHPPSRFAAEAVGVLSLLASTHLLWIFLTYPPVAWPQFGGGILAVGIKALLWLAIWRGGGVRYNMDGTYFSSGNSWVSWRNFVTLVAFVDLVSTIAWIIFASFSTTGLSAEMILLFTTVGAVLAALVAWFCMTPSFTVNPTQRGSVSITRRRRDAGSGSSVSNVTDEERQRRIMDLL